MRSGGVAAAILAAAGLAFIAWGARPRPPPPAAPAPAKSASVGAGTWTADAPTERSTPARAVCASCDVVVITMCSLRRDHVGLYGATTKTPAFDVLAAGGFRMDQAWAASNFTLAGLTAVLTGRFGSSTGVTGWDKGLVADVPTLPEILGHYGYRTGAFTIDAPSGFRPDYGLNRGFQRMEIIPPPRDTPDGRSRGGPVGPGGDSARPAARWIGEQPADAPILAMFHTRTAHYPFVLEDDPSDPVAHALWDGGARAPAGQAMPGTAGGTAQRGVVQAQGGDPVQIAVRAAGDAGVRTWRAKYAAVVERMDLDLAVMAEAIRKRGRPTVVVLLADHGESLDDHGELLHGDAYYDGVVHIPMVIRIPGLDGHPVPALSSQVDILPTILDAVGAVQPSGIDGASLLPLFRGEVEQVRTTTLVEGGVSWHDDGKPRGAVVSLPWALLRQDRGCDGGDPPRGPGEPATCLYDIGEDPGQTRNLAPAHPEIVADLQSRWDAFRAGRSGGSTVTPDPKLVDALHRTGYDFRPGSK